MAEGDTHTRVSVSISYITGRLSINGDDKLGYVSRYGVGTGAGDLIDGERLSVDR